MSEAYYGYMLVEDVTAFTSVDRAKDPQFYARFLDEGNKVPGIIASKAIILEGLRLREGNRVLDVGCGTGADVFEIAARVGPRGEVTGVDVSHSMIEEARKRAETLGIPARFEIGDAQELDFREGEFDAVRTERMLMH